MQGADTDMRTYEERLLLLYRKADILRKKQDRHRQILWGSASGVLAVFLIVLTIQFTGNAHGLGYSGLAGSSMLNESAGGYVLVAIAAFAAGVVLTALLLRYRSKKNSKETSADAEEQHTEKED